jgi:hypothetical protein
VIPRADFLAPAADDGDRQDLLVIRAEQSQHVARLPNLGRAVRNRSSGCGGHALLEPRIQRHPRYTTNRVTPIRSGVSPLFRSILDFQCQDRGAAGDLPGDDVRSLVARSPNYVALFLEFLNSGDELVEEPRRQEAVVHATILAFDRTQIEARPSEDIELVEDDP